MKHLWLVAFVIASAGLVFAGCVEDAKKCAEDSQCDPPDGQCLVASCEGGTCNTEGQPAEDGTSCVTGSQAGTCMDGACVGGTGGSAGTGGSGGSGIPCANPEVLSETFDTDALVTTETVETNGASEMATWEETGGEENGYRRMTHTLPSESSITVFHLLEQTYDPADGAIDHINYSESRIQFDPPFASAGIGTGLFLVQGGNRSTLPLPPDGVFTSTDWESVVLEDITPNDFSRPPNFTAGGPIQFGFYRSNSHGPGEEIVTTHGIDNWKVEICRKAAE